MNNEMSKMSEPDIMTRIIEELKEKEEMSNKKYYVEDVSIGMKCPINYEVEYKKLKCENEDIRKLNKCLIIDKADLERALINLCLKLH